MKRPLGVTILGSLNRILFGAIGFIMSVFGLISYFTGYKAEVYSKLGSPLMIKVALIGMLLISLIYMIIGHGVLKLKEKARLGTIYFAIYLIVSGIIFNFKNIFALNLSFTAALIYPIILLIYFTRPKVKEQFKQGDANIKGK